jgi:hypothetical protein
MDCVVAPFDQKLLLGEDEVNVTDPPAQKVVGPPAVMVGTAGIVFTITFTGVEAGDVQPNTVWVTVYEPLALTTIDCVVSVVDHVFPEETEEVNVTEPPAQKVVGPPAVTVGAAGAGFTLVFVDAEIPEEHPANICWTVKEPAVVTVIDWVVSPVDQRFPLEAEDVNTTELPEQKVVGPLAVIVGTDGIGLTVTVVGEAAGVVHPNPLVTVKEYDPEVVTVIDWVVSLVDQRFPVVEEEVSTTEPPAQKVVGPPAVIVGTEGFGLTVTAVAVELPEEHPEMICSTVYEPVVVTVMDWVVSPVDQRFPVEAEDVSITEPPLQKVVDPAAVTVGTEGIGVTVIVVGEAAGVVHPNPLVTPKEYDPEVVTVMDWVVSPVDQRFPVEEEEVSTTEPPAQKLVGPPAVIVGTEGFGLTVTAVAVELPEEHPEMICSTVYVPVVVTVIDWVVSPVDQRFPVEAEDVSITEPPLQKVVDPAAVTVGTEGTGLTVTVVGEAAGVVHPNPLVTPKEYDPEVVTVIDWVVSPVDQRFPVVEEEVSTTEPPTQKLVGPPAVIVGVDGIGFTVTEITLLDELWHPDPLTSWTE